MKKIGFIDIHLRDAKSPSRTGQEGVEWLNDALIYIFKDYSGRYELDATFDYSSDNFPSDIADFYVSAPFDLLNFRIINLPYSDKGKINKTIPFELENLIIANPKDIIFDAVVLDNSGSGFDILVVYAGRSFIEALIEELARKNIDPRVITSIDLNEIIHARSSMEPIPAVKLASLERPAVFDRVKTAEKELSVPTINLRTGPVAYTKDIAKARRSIRKSIVLGILLAAVINMHIAFNLVTTKNEIFSLTREIRSLYNSAFPGEKKIVDELYQMKSHIKAMQEKSDALSGVNPLGFLLKISNKPAAGIIYNEIQLENGFVKMAAEANSMEAIDRVKTGLSEHLSDVLVSDVKPAQDGKIFFTVAAKEKPI
jgi:type II secretory pathway component PulL